MSNLIIILLITTSGIITTFGQLLGSDLTSDLSSSYKNYPNANNNGVYSNTFSPLYRPYPLSESLNTGSSPYLRIGNNGGYSSYNSQYGSRCNNCIPNSIANNGQLFGKDLTSGLFLPSLYKDTSLSEQYNSRSGSSGCSNCMPNAIANSLANSGVGSIYYDISSVNQQQNTPLNTLSYDNPLSFSQPLNTNINNNNGIPPSLNNVFNPSYYERTGSSALNLPSQFCYPICNNLQNNNGNSPVFGSYNNNGLLNSYGSNLSPYNNYGSLNGNRQIGPYSTTAGNNYGRVVLPFNNNGNSLSNGVLPFTTSNLSSSTLNSNGLG